MVALAPRSVYTSAVGITALFVVAKALGFVEKQLLAFRFGATADVDAFLIAFGLLMVLFDLGRAVVGPALLPALANLHATRGRASTLSAAASVARRLAIGITALVAVVGLGAGPLMRHVLAPGLDAGTLALAVRIARILLPALIPLGLALVTYTLFHVRARFFAPALGELSFKIAGTAALAVLWLVPGARLEVLAWGYLCGGFAMLAIHLMALGTDRGWLTRSARDHATISRSTWLAAIPIALGAALAGARQLAESAFASRIGEGVVSVVAYSYKLVEFPTVAAAEPLALVFFALFTRLEAAGDRPASRAALAGALRSVVLIAAPLALGLAVLSRPIVELLFQWGAFDGDATVLTSGVLRLYAPVLPIVFVDLILTRFCLARGQVWPAMRIEILASLANIALLGIGGRALGAGGVPLAFLAGRTLKVIGVSIVVAKDAGEFSAAPAARFMIRALLAALAAWAAAKAAWELWSAIAGSLEGGPDVVIRGLAVAIPGFACVSVFAGVCHLLGIPEIAALSRWVTRTVAAVGLATMLTLLAGTGLARAEPVPSEGTETIDLGGMTWNRAGLARLPSALAFEMNRDGNLDLYVLDPREPSLRRLTDHPADDRYPAFAPDGRSLFFVSNRSGVDGIYRIALASGATSPVVVGAPPTLDPDVSPDGRTIALIRAPHAVGWNVLVRDLLTGQERNLTGSVIARNAHPSFSGDGRRLAMSTNGGRGWQIGILDVESGKTRTLTDDPGACRPDWSPTDDRIAYVTQRWDGRGDIAVQRAAGGPARRITRTESYDYFPAWSPDGRWLAYASTSAPDKGPNHEGPWHLSLASADAGAQEWLSRSPWSEREPTFAPSPEASQMPRNANE